MPDRDNGMFNSMNTISMRNVPKAHRVLVAACSNPQCSALHLVFVDESLTPMSEAVIPLNLVQQFIGDINDMAYQVAVKHTDGL